MIALAGVDMLKLLKEPFVHFVFLGTVLFALYALVKDDTDERPTIVIDDADIAYLTENFESATDRTPTTGELRGELEKYIRQEISYREAIDLHLDDKDQLVKERLAQKMEFLLDDMSAFAKKPDHETLKDYYAKHSENYMIPVKISFRQIAFTRASAADPTKAAHDLLNRKANAGPDDFTGYGDTTHYQYGYENKSEEEIENIFGNRPAKQIATLDKGSWQGPVHSASAEHLVYVTRVTEAERVDFENVKDEVRKDFMRQKREATRDSMFQQLRSKYSIQYHLTRPNLERLN